MGLAFYLTQKDTHQANTSGLAITPQGSFLVASTSHGMVTKLAAFYPDGQHCEVFKLPENIQPLINNSVVVRFTHIDSPVSWENTYGYLKSQQDTQRFKVECFDVWAVPLVAGLLVAGGFLAIGAVVGDLVGWLW